MCWLLTRAAAVRNRRVEWCYSSRCTAGPSFLVCLGSREVNEVRAVDTKLRRPAVVLAVLASSEMDSHCMLGGGDYDYDPANDMPNEEVRALAPSRRLKLRSCGYGGAGPRCFGRVCLTKNPVMVVRGSRKLVPQASRAQRQRRAGRL